MAEAVLQHLGLAAVDEHEGASSVAHVERLVVLVENEDAATDHHRNPLPDTGRMISSARNPLQSGPRHQSVVCRLLSVAVGPPSVILGPTDGRRPPTFSHPLHVTLTRPKNRDERRYDVPEIRTESVEFAANGATASGHLARPDDGVTHPGVIVIQEWWGMDEHIKDVANRFGREGFIALAPDLYHGEVATEPDEARKLVMNMNREQAMKDLLGAVKRLQAVPEVAPKKIGCIGFCMGGSLTRALAAATPDVAAAAPFHAGFQPPADQLAKIQAEMVCAFGADDGGIPMDNVRNFEATLKEKDRKATVKVYDGAPHSFFNDTKPGYRPDAAKDAWANSLSLFRRVLK